MGTIGFLGRRRDRGTDQVTGRDTPVTERQERYRDDTARPNPVGHVGYGEASQTVPPGPARRHWRTHGRRRTVEGTERLSARVLRRAGRLPVSWNSVVVPFGDQR
jgi:hypothetical protein